MIVTRQREPHRPATLGEHAPIELDAITALSDPVGVLSVYADADPALTSGSRSAWQAPVRAGLRRLVKDVRRTRPRSEWVAVTKRLEELGAEIESLLDPRRGGRGRALFAAIGGGPAHRVDVHAPLASLVALERHARALPLLAAAQSGAPAGAVTVSWDRLQSAEWRFGRLSPIETIDLGIEEPQRPRPATNPAVPQPFPERDRFASAAGARILTLLRDAAGRLAREADARGWDVLVVDGDPRLVEALEDSWRGSSARLVRSPSPVVGVQDAVAAERVGETVRARRADGIAETLRAVATSPAATRDPLVLERSLAEGRVEHLLTQVPPHASRSSLPESLVRRALATGAEVTVVPTEAGELGPAGAAALLRW